MINKSYNNDHKQEGYYILKIDTTNTKQSFCNVSAILPSHIVT
jgi:hypothetical protein